MKRLLLAIETSMIASSLLAAVVPSFEVKLVKDSSDCAYENYGNHTVLSFAETNGGSSVTFTYREKKNDPKHYDTEWGLKTREFKVTPGYEGFLQIIFAGNCGKGQRPGAKIYWLKEDGSNILYQDVIGKMSPLYTAVRTPGEVPNFGDTLAWTRFTVPPEAVKAKIDILVDNPDLFNKRFPKKKPMSATIRKVAYYEHKLGEPCDLDDLEPPQIKMITKSPNSEFTAPIKFEIVEKTGIDYAATKLIIDGKLADIKSMERDGNAYVYRPSVAWKEGSIHEVAIEGVDVRGNFGYDSDYVAFTANAIKHAQWTIRDDGMILKDGKPFFPFGWARIRGCEGNGFNIDNGVKEMLENGMNMGHAYMSPRDGKLVNELLAELKDVCEKRNCVLYYEPTYRSVDAKGFLPLAEKEMFAVRTRKLPYFWGIGDDTSMHVTPEQIRKYFRVCRAVDPWTLTISADVVGAPGLYEPYLPNVDIIAVESYPIGAKITDQDMAKSARNIDNAWLDIASAGVPGRTVIAIPQNFNGWGSWKRRPTMEEIRAQAYIHVATKARGIFYYASTGQRYHLKGRPTDGKPIDMSATCPWDDPALKAEFFAFTREFASILPSLVKRDATKQPTVKVLKGGEINVLGGNSIRLLLKEDGLLVAANTSHEEITAEITLPNGEKIEKVFPRYGYLIREATNK